MEGELGTSIGLIKWFANYVASRLIWYIPFATVTKRELGVGDRTFEARACIGKVPTSTRCLTYSLAEGETERSRAWKYWQGRAQALTEQERERHEGCHEDERSCLEGRNTLLLKEMVAESGFTSPRLFGHLLGIGRPVFSPFPAWSEFEWKATKTTRMLKQVRLSAR